jgi:hypothetical protein
VDEQHLSPEEFRQVCSRLSDGEWAQVLNYAGTLGKGLYGHEGGDLLHKVFVHTLTGERKCPRSVPVVIYLQMAMKSIESADLKAEERRIKRELEWALEQALQQSGHYDSPDLIMVRTAMDQVFGLFAEDPICQRIVLGLLRGKEGSEIRAELGLDEVTYLKKRTKIKRTIDNYWKKRRKAK